MALADLIAQLKANAEAAELRRAASQKALSQSVAASAMPSPTASGWGGGGGSSSGSTAPLVGGGGASSGNMPSTGGKPYWPAIGERHQHTSGYDWAKWSGDINVPGSGDLGNKVGAWKNGVVSTVNRWNNSYGKHIRVKHPDGSETLYAHLSKIGVKPGQTVKRGQRIGRVGSTGNSSGPHLHFEIKR